MKKATYIGDPIRKRELGDDDWAINTKGHHQFDQGDHWFRPLGDRFWGVVSRKSVVVHRKKT